MTGGVVESTSVQNLAGPLNGMILFRNCISMSVQCCAQQSGGEREQGVVVQVQTNTGATPLHAAVHYGRAEAAKVLLEAGADVNLARSDTGAIALHLAAEHGHVELTRWILDAGSKVHHPRTDSAATPVMVAVLHGRLKVQTSLALDVTMVMIWGLTACGCSIIVRCFEEKTGTCKYIYFLLGLPQPRSSIAMCFL